MVPACLEAVDFYSLDSQLVRFLIGPASQHSFGYSAVECRPRGAQREL